MHCEAEYNKVLFSHLMFTCFEILNTKISTKILIWVHINVLLSMIILYNKNFSMTTSNVHAV